MRDERHDVEIQTLRRGRADHQASFKTPLFFSATFPGFEEELKSQQVALVCPSHHFLVRLLRLFQTNKNTLGGRISRCVLKER